MASTYSTDLRLELIGQGEQPNLWGLTTNNNLGGLIEQAIAGTAFVVMPLDADYTLVAADGVVDQARAAILNITSATALTVPRTIVAPAVQKLYVVYNGTTGGQSILVQTSTAGLAVSIPNGYSKIIGCDGNNFYESLSAASQILLGANPVLPLQAATKQYVDTAAGAGPTYYAGLPLMNGIADPGLSGQYAGGTHVHPTDTTRAPLFNPAFTGSAASFPGTLTIGGLVAAPQLLVANVPSLANEVVSLGFADGRYAILNGTPPFAQVSLANPATTPTNAVRLQELTTTLGNYAVLTPAGSTNTFTNTNVFQGVTQVPTPTDAQVSSSTNVQYVLNKIAAATAGVSSVNVSAGTPLSAVPTTGNVILNITKANATTNGYLASGDFTTFSNKVGGLAAGTGISVSGSVGGTYTITNTSPGGGGGGVTAVGASAPITSSGGTSPTIGITPNTYVQIAGDLMTGPLGISQTGSQLAFAAFGNNTNWIAAATGAPITNTSFIALTINDIASPGSFRGVLSSGHTGSAADWPLVFSVGSALRVEISTAGNMFPYVDNSISCGQNGNRWSSIWAVNGTIQTSDGTQKTDISEADLGLDFILALRPVSYKWKVGQNIVQVPEGLTEAGDSCKDHPVVARPGIRTHYGLIAQEVKAVLGDKDFGGYIDDAETGGKGLRYDQFISPLIKSIQELKSELDAVKAELALLKG